MPARKTAPPPAERPATWTVLALPDTLYLHPLNTRSEPPDMEIAALADSIAAQGLLQNLNGYDDPARPGAVGIVAGGRRLRAVQLLHADARWPADRPVPVQVTTDQARAAMWAGTENEARTPQHPADEVRAYRNLRGRGHDARSIALTFAVSVRHVEGRLALADLPEAVLSALRQGRVTLDQARALTLAQGRDNGAEVIDAVLAAPSRWNEWSIKNALMQETIPATDPRAAFVGITAYVAAGGSVTADLFGPEAYLHDANLLDRLFAEKAEAETECLRATAGWQWAEFAPTEAWAIADKRGLHTLHRTTPVLPEGDTARLRALREGAEARTLTDADLPEWDAIEARTQPFWTDADHACGGILTWVRDGSLQIYAAYRVPVAAQADAGSDADGSVTRRAVAPAKPPESLRADMAAIRLLAVQTAILPDRDLLLDLLAWQLGGEIAPYEAPLGLSVMAPANTPERTEGLNAQTALLNAKRPHARRGGAPGDFAAFRALPEADRDRALRLGLARLFRSDRLAPTFAASHAASVRAIWTPTAAGYLARLAAPALDAIWAELVPTDHASRHTHDVPFGGLKKAQKATRLDALFNDLSVRESLGLSREANARIDAWLPPEMMFDAPGRPGAAPAQAGGDPDGEEGETSHEDHPDRDDAGDPDPDDDGDGDDADGGMDI